MPAMLGLHDHQQQREEGDFGAFEALPDELRLTEEELLLIAVSAHDSEVDDQCEQWDNNTGGQ